jgi:HlyD family secretion protein
VAEATAETELRKTEYESQQALAEKGFVSRNDLHTAETAYKTAVSRREAAKHRLAVAEEPHRPQEIEQARASYQASLASVERAESDLALIRRRSTPEDIASATARRDASKARLQSARAELKLTVNRTSPEELAAAEGAMRQAEAGLRRAEADWVAVSKQELQVSMLEAELRRSEAALEQAADQAGYTVIAAPIDGVVTRINVKEGEYVQGGAIALPSADIAMLVVTSDVIWIECNIDESDVDKVAEGQEAEVFLTDAEPLKGTVHHVSPSVRLVERDVRTFAVDIAVDEGDRTLRSGMSVDVDIIVKSTKDAVCVPAFAIFDDKEGKEYVYVVEDGTARKREITKGAEGIERIEVTDGVEEGDSVITSLEVKGLRDGKKVKIQEDETEETDDNEDQQTDEETSDDADTEVGGDNASLPAGCSVGPPFRRRGPA